MNKYNTKTHCMAALLCLIGVAGCEHGQASAELPEAQTPPCEGRMCGEACTACPDGTPGCGPEAVVRACDLDGNCVPSPVDCTPP